MALELVTGEAAQQLCAIALVADRRLWLTQGKDEVVEDGDPRAAFLLVGAGGGIPAAEVRRLGLRAEGGRIVLAERGPPAA